MCGYEPGVAPSRSSSATRSPGWPSCSPEVGAGPPRPIACQAHDGESLLVDFLSEALALSHIHREVYRDAAFDRLSATALEATLRGETAEAFERDVKAVTYHDVAVTRTGRGFEATIVYDI